MNRFLLVFLLLLFSLVTISLFSEEEPASSYIDWERGILKVQGKSKIKIRDTGNIIEWQYDAAVLAKRNLFQNFISSLSNIRVDGYNTAGNILLKDRDRNERIYRYINSKKITDISYNDSMVEVSLELPLFGEEGFSHILVTPGIDPGNFPDYKVYVYSTEFTGLVIDCRGLGRVPAISPKVFDEQHNMVYSADYIEEESFKKWGAVQYTDDPYYREFKDRVGNNPLRIVGVLNPKLINTDIAISTDDAMILLQNENTRINLQQARVIIVIDRVIQKIQ